MLGSNSVRINPIRPRNSNPIRKVSEKLFISFCPIMSFAKHLTVFNICFSTFTPSTYMVGIHFIYILSQGNKKPFISKPSKKSVHDDPKSKFRFFDGNEDSLIKRGEYTEKYGEQLIYDNLLYCEGETITSLMNKYDNQMLAKIMKVMEFYASSKTLSQERDAVLKEEYKELMKEKGKIGLLINSLNQKIISNY